jgi:transposase
VGNGAIAVWRACQRFAEEDAKRPNRERECIVNRIKSTLARLGIRDFKPTLRKAAERLATVHTPEGMPLPPNALAERDMARLGFVVSQIREIEDARISSAFAQPAAARLRHRRTSRSSGL